MGIQGILSKENRFFTVPLYTDIRSLVLNSGSQEPHSTWRLI